MYLTKTNYFLNSFFIGEMSLSAQCDIKFVETLPQIFLINHKCLTENKSMFDISKTRTESKEKV